LKIYYNFFIHLFAYEFVYDQLPENNLNDQYFDKYLLYWIKKNYLIMNNSTYQINRNYSQQISLIINPFEQYARTYLLIYEQDYISLENNYSTLIKLYQKNLLTKVDSQNIISVLASSSNILTNALRTLNTNDKSKLRHMLTELFQPMSIHLRAKL
jgi:hypothetical protein